MVKRLKQHDVPSVFSWTKPVDENQINRQERAMKRDQRKHSTDSPLVLTSTENILIDVGSEIECISNIEVPVENDCTVETTKYETSSQTEPCGEFSIERFRDDNKTLLSFTGCESYDRFLMILHSLGPVVNHLNYYYHDVKNVNIENQLFLTLVKLRLHWTNFNIAKMADISETTVANIFITWINFMYHQWKEEPIWPSQELVRFFAPSDFRRKFPKTRVMIDGTECPVKKPAPPAAQQATFSTYKNRNTVKILVGATPGGLISYVSPAYGGSTSDRQIVERSGLMTLCDPCDSIMADKGFNVQHIFASYAVAINMPSFFSKKNRIDGKTVQKDRAISSKLVHIERLIGLAKTFKIMREPLIQSETNLSTEILFVCCMLCNFKDNIISKNA
ncbi:hypothetical protein SNE40_009718 [Patella caerulea]|uniref:DDE Tnp4 domain-containing protein n=1 Tax=Patella caerulea TaxID=87958 RepID=A0AAN8JRU5_PATCE